MLSIVQLQFYPIRKNRQQKNKAAHPKRADGFMASAFADRANRTGREVGIYDFLRKSNESFQIPRLNVFGDKGNTCHAVFGRFKHLYDIYLSAVKYVSDKAMLVPRETYAFIDAEPIRRTTGTFCDDLCPYKVRIVA